VNRKQIVFAAFIFCLVSTFFVLASMMLYEIPPLRAVIAVFMYYVFSSIIVLFGVGCMVAFEKLGEG